MNRREFLGLAAAAPLAGSDPTAADITLRIAEINAEIAPKRFVTTTAYNGQTPGPVLRMQEGRPVTVEVINETQRPELVHWHGFQIPPEVDGAHEEGTPMVQGRDRRRYAFTPGPSGTRWYHTHAMAGHNLKIAGYSGQFGMVVVAARGDAARYDVEVPVILHEWEPYFAAETDIDYRAFTVNGKMLGAGEPVRVKHGQRVLFRVLNASATMTHRLALAGHTFVVTALDGNAVKARSRDVLELAPGERIDAIVEMTEPGVWVFGETDKKQREAGAGIVVEYANEKGRAQWREPVADAAWDIAGFGEATAAAEPDARIRLVIEPGVNGNLWAINGKSFPNTDAIVLRSGARNRLVFENRGMMDHPVHTHRHTFEIARYAEKAMSGVKKDVVLVPMHQTVEVDVIADSPGPSLLHCHQQFHMDFGFMAVIRY